ncbi:Non-ribosomal peptide synthetase [Pleurotus pulmonarius]
MEPSNYLEGYKLVEWPDLSGRRHPSRTLHRASATLRWERDWPSFHPIIVSAIARIVGAYCGVSDVLVGSRLQAGLKVVRVLWEDTTSWDEVIASVQDQLNTAGPTEQEELVFIRKALDLDANQMPCLALYTLSSHTSEPNDFPFSISFDSARSSLELTALSTTLHPSFAPLILNQLTSMLQDVPSLGHTLIHKISDLPSDLLSLYEPNTSGRDLLPATAMDFLTEQAEKSPDSTAFYWCPDSPDSHVPIQPSDSMTYRDWHARSNQFARWLIERGLEKEDRVAVCMKRDRHFHVSIMGIMRAGGCYVPIDPELPDERKKYISSDSQAKFVLTTKDLTSISLFDCETIFVEEPSIQQEISAQLDDRICSASLDSLAYLLYTSGTTGNPKGCLITHEGLVEAIWAISRIASIAPFEEGEGAWEGRYLATASIAFDVHLAEVFVSLSLGTPLYNVPRSILLENLSYYVVQFGITHLGIVPSLMEATLSVAQEDGDLENMKLRYICSGGEKITDAILDKWANHPRFRLANFYGPSEATIGCCARYMDLCTPKSNIGRTFENVSGYVVDDNMNIVVRGGVGELVVGGPLVGRGYHGRPDLTGKVFLEWPRSGQKAYRTGDLVRMMPDSTFEILGRVDTQIKLRGVRIESEGISAIIRKAASPSARISLDAITILANHPKIGTDQLVSFIAWDPNITVSTRKASLPSISAPPQGLLEAIQSICATELASYMRPSHVIPLQFLPLSSNGKADSKSLATIFRGLDLSTLADLSSHRETDYASGTLNPLAATPSQTPTSSPPDSFSRLWLPTISREYQADDVECILPALPVQEGVLSRSAVDGTLYVQTTILACNPQTSLLKLQQAWKTVVTRHQILRAVFYFDRSLIQIILRPGVAPLPWIEKPMPSIPEADFPAWFAKHEAEGIARYLNENMSNKPLFQLTAYTSHSKRCHLVLSLHHALFDGSSLPILFQDLEQVYHGEYVDSPAPLKSVLDTIASVDLVKAELFWRSMFKDFSWPASPFRHSTSTEWEEFAVPFKTSLSEFRNMAAQACVTLQALLTCTFAALFARVYGQDDIVFGTIRSGRLQAAEGVETAICPLIAVHPIRVNPTRTDTLTYTQKVIAEAMEYEHVGLSQIQTWVRPGLPLFDVLFSLAIEDSSNLRLFEIVQRKNPVPDFPLAVQVSLDPIHDTLEIQAAWLSEAVDEQFVKEFLRSFEKAASSISRLGTHEVPSQTLTTSPANLSTASATSLTPSLADRDLPQTNRLRALIAEFLNLKESFLQDDTSLVSLGLDSLKSVGLSRTLRQAGLGISAPQLMSNPSLRQLAALLGTSDTPNDLRSDGKILRLRPIISDFLNVAPSLIKADVSLVSLGLDSLKSVGLSRILRREGFPLSASQLMSGGSLSNLVVLLESKTPTEIPSYVNADTQARVCPSLNIDEFKLSLSDCVGAYPVTELQAGMLSQTISSGGHLYVHAFPLRLSQGVQVPLLKAAWKRAVNVLSILRTSFHFSADDGVWCQVTHSQETLDWSTDSFTTETDYSNKVAALITSLNLTDELSFRRPPFLIRLYSSLSTPHDNRLVLVMHHALYDGVSLAKLMETVASLYEDAEVPTVVQFTDLLPTLKEHETSGTRFWLEKLRGFVKQDLPPKLSRTDSPNTPHLFSEVVKFDPSLLASVLSRLSITVQCIAQAALSRMLQAKLQNLDILFGHVVSGRSIPDAEEVIGPLLNTIPCRTTMLGTMRNIDLLKAVHAWNIAAMSKQQFSLRSLQKSLGMKSLWDVLFVFQPLSPPPAPFETLWAFDTSMGDDAKVQYPLTIEVHQHLDHFVINAVCRSEYMSSNELKDAVHQMANFTTNLIARPEELLFNDTRPPQLPVTPGSTEHRSTLLRLLRALTELPADRVTSQTPLAALGIDSITAIQLAARCRKHNIHILASDISSSNTIGDLMAKVTSPPSERSRADVDIAVPTPEADLIEAQLGLRGSGSIERITTVSAGMKWLIGAWQRSEGTRFQHVFAYRLPPTVDALKLREAWFALVRRHEILRTTFACEEDSIEPRLVTFKPDAIKTHWSQEHYPSRNFYRCALEKIKNLVVNPPDLNSPPTRTFLLSSARYSYLVVQLHHFQYDAWSLQLLMEDLSNIYYDREPTVSCDLRSFLVHSTPDSDVLEVQKSYWRQMFPSTFRPVYFPRLIRSLAPVNKRTICTEVSALANASLCDSRARALGVSLQAMFLACWAELQAQYTSRPDATFGLWHSGRKGALDGIESLAVSCLNVLPLRLEDVTAQSILKTAQVIEGELQRRTAAIEQSDLSNIDEWVGGKRRALCNVYVNIVKVAPDVTKDNPLVEPVHIPYWVPDALHRNDRGEMPRLAVTDLIRDDVMIDIVTVEVQDTVLMSVDASASMMDQEQAKEVIQRWAILVKGALGLV